MSYTPGPWHAEQSVGGWTDLLAGGEVVARFDGNHHPTRNDLRIMEAAPEMAEALRGIEEELHGRGYAHRCHRALLRRIRGEV